MAVVNMTGTIKKKENQNDTDATKLESQINKIGKVTDLNSAIQRTNQQQNTAYSPTTGLNDRSNWQIIDNTKQQNTPDTAVVTVEPAADTSGQMTAEQQAQLQALQNQVAGYQNEAWKNGVSQNTLENLANYQLGYDPSASVAEAQAYLAAVQAQKPGEYQQSDAVTQAMNYLQQVQGQRPGEYQESPEVAALRQALADLEAQKPGAYESRYQPQIDALLQQIQNPDKFNYELNSDNLFKSYQDYYTQMGKQAALNAQGQAAALTGGYGNSYAESVGQQTNQQYLLGLYDKGLELRDRAYQEYLQGLENNKDLYNILQNAENSEYGRYRDTVSDYYNEQSNALNRYQNERNFDYGVYQDQFGNWMNEAQMAQNMLNNERNFDYGMYQDKYGNWQNELAMANENAWNERNFDYGQYADLLNYYTGLAQIENQAWETEAQRQEAIRQYEKNFAEQVRQYEESKAAAASYSGGGYSGGSSTDDWEREKFYANLELNAQKEANDQANADRAYYSNLVTAMLANGQMPSNEMLAAAGLSAADAALLMAQPAAAATPTYNYPGTPKPNPGDEEKGEPKEYVKVDQLSDGTNRYAVIDSKGKLLKYQTGDEGITEKDTVDDTAFNNSDKLVRGDTLFGLQTGAKYDYVWDDKLKKYVMKNVGN